MNQPIYDYAIEPLPNSRKGMPDREDFYEEQLEELEAIQAELQEIDESNFASLKWAVDNHESQLIDVATAIELAKKGEKVFIAQDDDGYWFAQAKHES